MIPYRIVPDGLSAFGVELTSPGAFRSVRGFASVEVAWAWIIEQDKADARRSEAAASRVLPACKLIERNHALLRQASALCAHMRQVNQTTAERLVLLQAAQAARQAARALNQRARS